MSTLETQIEALALNYITHGLLTVVNSVWTWIAVVTAAVSLWKIKLSSQQQQLVLTAKRCTSHDKSSSSLPEASEKSQLDTTTSTSVETKRTCLIERQGSTKIKFSVHYEQEQVFNESDDNNDGCASVEEESEECLRWCEDRERMWDMGWYRCQDLTVLDGSVVRLWDGRKRRCAAVTFVA